MFDLTINDYDIIYIIWNIILGIIPFFLVLLLFKLKKLKSRIKNLYIAVTGFVWLIFAPNAPYIITDVRHINGFCPKTINNICVQNAWMIIFFFLYGIIGLVLYFYSLEQMIIFLKREVPKKLVFIFPFLIIPIFSLGLLLGLVDRLNSWDIFIRINVVLETSLSYFVELDRFINLLIFSIIMLVLYYLAKLIFKPIEDIKALKYFTPKK